jgi:hypothetical protein
MPTKKYWVTYRRRSRTQNVGTACEDHLEEAKARAARIYSHGEVGVREITPQAVCDRCKELAEKDDRDWPDEKTARRYGQ